MNLINTRNPKLDFAKGLVVTFVIYAHVHPFDLLVDNNSNIYLRGLAFLIKQFYWQVILIVVPTFLLVSFSLNFEKFERYGTPYLWKRIRHLIKITAFWVGVQFAAYFILVAVLQNPDYTWIPKASPLRLFFLGGPNLPIVQGSVFYYMIVLTILTLLAYLFYAARDIKWFAPLVGGAIVAVSIWFLESRNVEGKGLQYWRMECFFAYVPIAYYLRSRTKEQLKLLSGIFFVFYIIFSIQDILIRQGGWGIGVYSRISLIFGSTAFMSWLLSRNDDFQVSKTLTFLSTYTLGLVSVHKFWQVFFILLITPLGLSKYLHPLSLENLVIAVLVTIMSILFVYIAGRTKLRFAVA